MKTPEKDAGGSIILTGFLLDDFDCAMDANGRSGREVGKRCCDCCDLLDCAPAADSGEDTLGECRL